MTDENFSFFDEKEETEEPLEPNNEYETIYYKDIWFWCKPCSKHHRWTECPKPIVL